MSYQQSQNVSVPQTGQSFEQKDRVKQGGIDIEHDIEHHHHEASTMNTLSVENLSSSNLDHDAAEAIHKGWEKATDTIAQGVEVVKRLIMHELPPVEGESLKEKALNLKDMATEKVQEVKEKVQEQVESAKQGAEDLSNKAQEQVESVKQGSEDLSSKVQEQVESAKQGFEDFSNKASEKVSEVKDEIKQKGQDLQRGTRTSGQTDIYRSEMGSTTEWQPTQQMKEVAREKLGEFKEKYHLHGEGAGKGAPEGEDLSSGSNFQSQQQSFSKPESHQESAIKIEHGQEQELSSTSNTKLQEVEILSHQLNEKIEELKRSAALPTNTSGETIIIIQQGVQPVPSSQQQSQSESQFSTGQQSFSGSQGQEQQRPKLGHRGEQEWRSQEAPSQEAPSQEKEESSSNESGKDFSEKISEKAQELKEGFRQGFDKGFEKAGSHLPSSEEQGQEQQGESQPSEGSQSFTGKLGDKIKEKVGDKVTDIKDSYQSNLQELERKAEERRSEQPKEHHESEHHLTTESESFKPSAESKSLLEHELQGGQQESQQGGEQKSISQKLSETAEQVKEKILPAGESHPEGSEHHLSASSESFKPSSETKSLLQNEFGSGSQEEGSGSSLKEKLSEAAEQVKEKVLPSSESSQPLKEQISNKIDEVADKIMPSQEGEKESGQSQDQDQAPPAEMKETITYHPRDIKGYEIQYVPKHESEEHESQSKSEQEESKPIEERIPFLDRVQHGFETASHTYQTIKGLFKPGHSGEEEQTNQGSGSGSEQKQSAEEQQQKPSAPPAEMKETITYHPRDIRGYEIEYVPKHSEQGQGSQSQSEGQGNQSQSAPVETKEQFTYHPREIQGYEIEFVPKSHKEEEHTEGQHSEQKSEGVRTAVVDRVQHGLETVKGFFQHGQSQEKESSGPKVPESASELSNILQSQAEVLKTKYSALRDDQPHGEELVKSESTEKSQEGQEHKGLLGRVSGALHTITDKFSHGASNLEGKFEHAKEQVQPKEEPKQVESPREKIYEFNPKAKKAEEKSAESEEKSSEGFISRIGGKISHGIEGVKEKFHSGKEESSEETSTEKNQSLLEKIQGKIQGKETGEEVDKEGFRKVHDGFSESVVELKKEQNEQFHEQVETANENPFEPLRTKQAALIDHPVTNSELVGGNLKEMTANFDENAQEMIPEDKDEEKKGLFQKMKQGLLSKLGRGDKETEESA